MPISLNDLKLYGSATMPDDDVPVAIGGAIDTQKKVDFTDFNGSVQAVSSAAGDTTQTVTVTFRDSAGVKTTAVVTLSGLTPVAFSPTMERLLKAVKSATTAGDVAVEAAVAERSGTAQAGAATTITLDAGASAVDDFFLGMICRLTAGTGNGQIRQVIAYNGTTKVATVNHPWTTNPDATTTFRLAKGFFFDKNPAEVLQVRRPFFDAAANPPAGAQKKYYDKAFFRNSHGSLALTSSVVKEFSDPSGLIAFGLETVVNGSGTNGAGNNRLVTPSGITFDSADKSVPGGGTLNFGDVIGVWFELTLAGGAAAQKTTYTPRLEGNTV